MANLFTSQTPSVTDASDGTPGITTATTVVFAVDGTVTGVRFYATTTVGGTYTGALWEVTDNDAGTGTLLASKTAGVTPTGGTWNSITFDTPVSVTAGTPYRVGIFSGAGRYVATVGFFSSGLTNGDISAPANNGGAGPYTVFQGTFAINAALTYPTSSSGSACYFADVEFTSGVGPTPISVGDTGAATDVVTAAVTALFGDAASGAEALTLSAAALLADAASVAEILSAAASAHLVDTAAAAETLTVTAGISLADLAAAAEAVDNGANIPKSLGDAATALDRLRTTTIRRNAGTTVRPFTGITLRP